MTKSFWMILAAMVAVLGRNGVQAATYTWSNGGTDWNSSSSWSPGGSPTAADVALFAPGGSLPGTAVNNPTITASSTALSLTIAPNQNAGGWTFGGSSTLTLGGTGSTGITTYGPQTTVFNGPSIAGATGFTAGINVTNGSRFVLAGTSVATTNLGTINVNNGTFTLNDTGATSITNRLSTTNTIKQQGGGTFELLGNSSGGIYNVGSYNVVDNNAGGRNTIRVISNSTTANTTLNFANTGSFSLRQGTRNVLVFESNGALGTANGPRITFAGTPITGTSGQIANSVATPGWATVKDSTGTNFATYSGTAGVGVVSVTSANQSLVTVTTATDAPTLAGVNNAAVTAQLNSSANISATASITAATLRITPATTGQTLAMGTNNIVVFGLMLDGNRDYAITGTGTFGSGTHYAYVNDANTTLSLGLNINSANNTVFAGPGFVDLSRGTLQNFAGASRITVAGGVLRANEANFGLTSSGAGQLNLTGGIFEIKNGSNGSGTTADFRRNLGTGTGTVNWGAQSPSTANEQGSGGFSAFGAAASVNIGGSASPASLQWNQANFVGDGYALKFGSVKSDSTLRFQNGLQLDNGTAPYQLREINVTKGTGTATDRTNLSGIITGTSTADLIKTGNGTLSLAYSIGNTYDGNTFVQGGTLLADSPFNTNNPTFSATGTGTVTVFTGATLGGAGYVGGPVTVTSGGTIRGDSLAGVDTLALGSNLAIASDASNGGKIQSTVTGAPGVGNSKLTFTSGTLTLGDGTGKFTIDLKQGAVAVTEFQQYTITLATATGGGLYKVGNTTLLANDVVSQSRYTVTNDFQYGITNNYVLAVDSTGQNLQLTFTPVPEPGAMVALGAAGLGLLGAFRRYRKGAVDLAA